MKTNAKQYLAVSSAYADELEEKVRELMKKNYQPCGGVAMTGDSTVNEICQAMVLVDNPDDISIKAYAIAYENGKGNISQMVQEYMEQGYQPFGGIATCGSYQDPVYAQAVIRYCK